MRTIQNSVSEHYTTGALAARISAALESSGKDSKTPTVDDLAPVDEFHIRGRVATEELARWAALRPGHSVLDAGCGIGGTSRYLAARFGCRVTGLDLTEEYCRVAEELSARAGLSDRTSFRHGSALELPFEDASFDVVWTEHAQMNIEDKERFYGELHRVLKPGGQLAFHDIFAGSGGAVLFPVPWAGDASISHLIAPDDLRELLTDLGLTADRWEDKTSESVSFFESVLARVRTEGWMPLGLHLLMGENASEKFSNVLRNLAEGRVKVVQAVMRRSF